MNSRLVTEEWRNVKGFEDYQVSNLGRVKSKERIVPFRNSTKIVKERILKTAVDRGGYYYGYFCKNSVMTKFLVHRLVAQVFPELVEMKEQFKDIPFEKLEVNHKNQCKWDNNVWNLELCDRIYNHNYGDRNIRATRHLCRKVQQYDLNNNLIAEYQSFKEAEKQTGICYQSISQCCRGVNYSKTAGGYIWKYKS